MLLAAQVAWSADVEGGLRAELAEEAQRSGEELRAAHDAAAAAVAERDGFAARAGELQG